MNPLSVFWLILTIALFTVEATTFNLTTIWFAIGSVVGLILSMTKVGFLIQLISAIAVSFVLLIFTKPIVEKKLKPTKVATNADLLIGKTAVVKSEISPEKFAGEVSVKGQIWSAVSADESTISVDEKVRIVSIDGVKLVVEKER